MHATHADESRKIAKGSLKGGEFWSFSKVETFVSSSSFLFSRGVSSTVGKFWYGSVSGFILELDAELFGCNGAEACTGKVFSGEIDPNSDISFTALALFSLSRNFRAASESSGFILNASKSSSYSSYTMACSSGCLI